MALQAVAQHAVEPANQRTQQQHDQDRNPGIHAQTDEVEQKHVGSANHKRNREIQAAQQRHQRLADAGQTQECSKQQHGLDVLPRRKALDKNAAHGEHGDQHHQPDKRAAVVHEQLADLDREDQQSAQHQKGDDVEPIEKAGHRGRCDQENAQNHQQGNDQNAVAVHKGPRQRKTAGTIAAVFRAELGMRRDIGIPGPDDQRKGGCGIKNQFLQHHFLHDAQDETQPGNQNGQNQADPLQRRQPGVEGLGLVTHVPSLAGGVASGWLAASAGNSAGASTGVVASTGAGAASTGGDTGVTASEGGMWLLSHAR